MNVKKSLESRIRGWFPSTPNLPSIKRATRRHSLTNKRILFPVSVLLICLLAVTIFVSSTFFFKSYDGWVSSREIERISFPGGDIIVKENRQSPSDKGYITLNIEANITSKENLEAYVDSRTTALNTLLDTAAANSTIEAIITLKAPISPQDFASLCETSIEKLGEYAIILTDEATGTQSSEVVWFPRPQEAGFIENITSTREGSKLEGIIAFECYLQPKQAKSLQSDPRVLLVDPLEDQQLFEAKERYDSKGFDVLLDRPFFEEMWTQYVKLTRDASEGI